MRIFNYCYTGFTSFFSTISTSLNIKGLIVQAVMLANATEMLIFCFVPICIANSDTHQTAVIAPISSKYREGSQAMLDGVNLYVEEVNKRGRLP